MRNAGYFRTPDIHGDTIVFVSEDDCWSVPADGGVARRLTANRGEVARPVFSPDGSLLALSSREEHHLEVYVMPADGGQLRRLTFLGANSFVAGWTPEGEIVYRTDAAQPFARWMELYAIAPNDPQPRVLPYGPANEISFGARGGVVLGRNTNDPARWKRYRGGTAGHLWVDARGSGTFKRLLDLKADVAHPMWIGSRIYFISDHEGIGNVYSCRPDGGDLRRHTDHGEYYARFARSDGQRIVYQHAAEIWIYDPASDGSRRVEIEFPSSRTQRNRKFVPAAEYLHGFEVHPDGHSVALETRGRIFTMPLWEGAAREQGAALGARYRLGQWLHDGERVVVISDESGEEALEVHAPDGSTTRFDALDLGRAHELVPSPKTDHVAVANHRNELILVDVAAGTAAVLDRSEHAWISGVAWSPDGAWVAYAHSESANTTSIKLCEVARRKTHAITAPEFNDYAPSFDPEGKYLYFLSRRTFDPVYDQHFFDLGFPRGARPYVVTLRADLPSPLIPTPRGFGADPKNNGKEGPEAKGGKEKDKKEPEAVRVDLDGIASRIVALPVPESRYNQIVGIKGKVLFTSAQAKGSLGLDWYAPPEETGALEVYDFGEQKHEILISGVSEFRVARDGATLVYRNGRRLRALKAGDRPDEKFEKDPPSRKSGWLDLGRVRVSVDPGLEWQQMLREIWRLQRDNYWDPGMCGVDWPKVYERYRPLVEKVATRLEFSDLVWEMQGELGTSHAYDIGGDHRPPPAYAMGYLGADLSHDRKSGGYRVDHIVQGDPWDENRRSPLAGPGVNVREGDVILAVNGRRVSPETPPHALLVNQAGATVELTVGDARGRKPRTVLVKTLRGELPARYREWVEANRARVHEATNGRVGYVHIPNMGPVGWAEFHRYYLSEVERDGLIVDVRYNGGGHVSQLILEKLARKPIGFDLSRWGKPNPYPRDSVLGPMVALTNEHAGSDGDIFTHAFKLMQLGPVVGKRTWGGIVGIWPRHRLADDGVTTQPEFHTWFVDVGWGVENYGTDPDHDVDIAPQHYAAGRDPQMEKALELVQRALKKKGATAPAFPKPPSLALPTLPSRDGATRTKRPSRR